MRPPSGNLPQNHPSDPDQRLSWALLLAAWTDFAQAAVAIPPGPHAEHWKRSVPAIIELQAATHALCHLDALPARDRHVALDTAEALITSRSAALESLWATNPPLAVPSAIVELISDAHSAAAAARSRLSVA